MDATLCLKSSNSDDTVCIGRAVGGYLEDGDVVLMEGTLGAGKTCISKGIAQGLGIEEDVISPTFNILLEYAEGRLPFFHFDLYRLEDSAELEDIDFFYLSDMSTPGACIVEWASKFQDDMPDDVLQISISVDQSNESEHFDDYGELMLGRIICMRATGPRSLELIKKLSCDDIINRYAC